MRFEIWQDGNGAWRWHLLGGNGEIVAQGEGYATKSNAQRAIRRMKAEVWRAKVVE